MAQAPAGCAPAINSTRDHPAASMPAAFRSRRFGIDLVIALGLVGSALGLRLLLAPWLGDKYVFMFFSPAAALAAWYRGRRCGLMATLVGAAAIAYVWLPEAGNFRVSDLDDLFHLAAFVGLGFLLTYFLGRGRDALRVLQATAAREIEAQIGLRRANEALERQVLELRRTESAWRDAKEELTRVNASLEQRVQERTAAQAALAAEMESFAYTVSHDLRSPLRAISGFAEALREDHSAGLTPDAHDMIDRIIRGTTRMDRLITALLTYSRVNRHEIQVGAVSIGDCVRQVIASTPEFQAPRARIEVAENLPTVLAADALLMQVFANLLGNAVKFVPAGRTPEVKIHAETTGATARIWIVDNGIGIRPEFQSRLFRLFERLEAGRNYEGSGMGLAIVRRALARMDGTVGAESDGQSGSRFWLQLKLAGAAVAEPTPAPMLAAVD